MSIKTKESLTKNSMIRYKNSMLQKSLTFSKSLSIVIIVKFSTLATVA
jgi:hypothetical protein